MSREQAEQINRMRTWLLVLVIIVLFAAGAAPIAVIVFLENQVDEAQFEINCLSARSNIQQLAALEEIADHLGLPHEFRIPELPEECL